MAERIEAAPAVTLAVYAHPDDAEVSCGGSLARWAASGGEVHVVLCTQGDKGSSDPNIEPAALAETRAAEAADAGARLGITAHHRLGYPDGEIEDDAELRARL